MSTLPSSSIYSPPPYNKPSNETEITQVTTVAHTANINGTGNNNPHTKLKSQHHHHRRVCQICKRRHTPLSVRDIGPYLIHRTKPDLVIICPCSHKAHPICLKNYGTDYVCNMCNYIYKTNRYVRIFAQFLCFLCHLLSLASTVGLVFGLSQLGKALDEIGLGSEYGPKLDGDETWQDHEMTQIVEWLNIVHFTTGIAGEALLGLVYIVGVCSVIGLDRALIMISNILYIQLDWKRRRQSLNWISKAGIFVFLFLLGLALGTYLLFFSWIWASVLHRIRKQVLNVKYRKNQDHQLEKQTA